MCVARTVTPVSFHASQVLGLYFSAHWCPPCRAFTPTLADWYNNFKKGPNGSKFDIVFVSSDRDDSAFDEYYGEMPWLALPFSERDKKVRADASKIAGRRRLCMRRSRQRLGGRL